MADTDSQGNDPKYGVEELLTTTEAMEELGVSRTAIRHAIETGKLKSVKRGRTLFVVKGSLDSYKPMNREEAGRVGAQKRWEAWRNEKLKDLPIEPVVKRRRGRPRKDEAIPGERDTHNGGGYGSDGMTPDDISDFKEFMEKWIAEGMRRYFHQKLRDR